MRPVARRAAAFALTVLGAFAATPVAAQPRTAVPWVAGEYLEYNVKLGFVTAGSGRMQVTGVERREDRDHWHIRFDISGGVPFCRVKDSYDSWMDVETLNSTRFEKYIQECGRPRIQAYEIFPSRKRFLEIGKGEKESVANPLDEASMFFFVRTIPLEVGKEYAFDRFYDPKANPVIIRVLRKETIEVPAGKFDAIVVQPIIKAGGLFGEGGHAEIWLSDDKRRIMLQMKASVPVIGSLSVYLKKISIPEPAKTPER
jgi:hypothetical protein